MEINKIKQLSDKLIAKIAAGQVVDRPQSVVKELVENSLDAGSKNITIELEKAGKKKIIVTDNGVGMSKSDLKQSFLHHTTSKISKDDDLFTLKTFGFRGEALSSIVAVSKVKIESKIESELGGKYLELIKGEVVSDGSVGMPTGTRITVTGLFSFVPARKKFLKSESTEFAHILQTLTALALVNTSVGFTLTHNKKTIFDLPENQTVLERASALLSSHISNNLLPIKISDDHFKITGFLGKPQIGTPSKQRQFLFVNGRSVSSKAISSRLKEVFSTLLEPRSNPAFILFINLSPDLIDVNVDPQKTQVKFITEADILKSLEKEAKQVLENANLTYDKKGANGFYEEYNMDFGIAKMLREQTDGWNVKDAELIKNSHVLQVHNLYLVAQTKRGLLIVDQHAAHERILYQEFLDEFNKKRHLTISLKKSIKLDFPISEQQVFLENKTVFEKLGFGFEEISDKQNSEEITTAKLATQKSQQTQFEVIKIPKVFETKNIGKLLQEMLHDIIKDQKPKDLDVGTHRTLAYLACRTAIKAGEKLTQKESKRLIEKLQQTDTKYTCPHGRPVEVELDLKYLDKMFKRVK